jgi:hypothetical protein
MYIFTKKDKKNFNDLKYCLKEFGLPIKAEKKIDAGMIIESEFEHKEHSARIFILLNPSCKVVTIILDYGIAEGEKITTLYELIDRINMKLCTCHFIVCPDTGHVSLCSGMHLTHDRISKKEFLVILGMLIAESCFFAPLIVQQIESDKKPEVLWNQFLIENKDRID